MTHPKVEISWEAGAPPPELDEPELRRALILFLRGLAYGGGGVSLLMAGNQTLAALNARFRGREEPTDILSWDYGPAQGEPPPGAAGEAATGEMALSLEQAARQAGENGWKLQTEVLRLLAHGCAHLAGYDHQTEAEEAEMCRVEARLLAAAGLENIYPARTTEEKPVSPEK